MQRILMLLVLPVCLQAQNKYGLKTTGLTEYKESLAASPENELVDLSRLAPKIILEIGYATTRNFTGKQIYTLPRAYARKPVAAALLKAQGEFEKLGYGIKVYDAYRPYKATV